MSFATSTYTPYPYQRDCLGSLDTGRRKGQTRQFVVMATGLGKTVTAAFDIKRLCVKSPGRVLFLCHSTHILEQARETFESILGSAYSYGYFHGTKKHTNVDVLFATFQTMEKCRDRFRPNEFKYVVVDEVHRAPAATFRPTVEYFQPDYLTGWTATPDRTDGFDIAELFDCANAAFELDLFKALARRYLCDVVYHIMTDELLAFHELNKPISKLSISELNRTLFVPKRDEEIARIITEKIEGASNARAMIFCQSIEHAERMARLLPFAMVLHSNLKQSERSDRLKKFRRGVYSSVITVDMLNEGIDVPEANILFFLRSTASQRIFLQQLGRGLRKSPGKEVVHVYDFAGNCERFEMIEALKLEVEAAQRRAPIESGRKEGISRKNQPIALQIDDVAFTEEKWDLLSVIRTIRQTLSREDLLSQLQQLARVLKRTPTTRDVRDASRRRETATQSTFEREFGSWNQAIEAAGLAPLRTSVAAERSELIARVIRLADYLGRTPTSADLKKHGKELGLGYLRLYSNEFGSWADAVKAAGLRSYEDEKRDEILVLLVSLARRLEKTRLSRTDIDRAGPEVCPNSTTVVKYLGSWEEINTLLQEALDRTGHK